MASLLGEKLVHLSLEIEDRTKSADLLSQLIGDQKSRHDGEVTNFEQEQTAFLQKFTEESKESQAMISHVTKSLVQRKKTLESQINELSAKKQDVEYSKKKNLDAVKRGICETKEIARKAYKQEKSQREKSWFDGRVSEIHKLTWKGIQPNVERLARKHKEQCEEIKSKTQFSKQKLDLQCENDLSERIQAFQRSEQQSNACITQRSDFANLLLREQNEHAMSLMKLKDKFMQDEEGSLSMYSLQLETLAKDNDVALSKLKSSKSVQQLNQQLLARTNTRKQELESRLGRVGKDIDSSQAQWEESWNETSSLRVEKKNKQKLDALLEWRKHEVDSLIRKSIGQVDSKLSKDDEAQLTFSHEESVAALNLNISELQAQQDETKAR
ncbi:hypothetical protein ACHAXR_001501, partial [Thalassiosira sp. AJA248-18]